MRDVEEVVKILGKLFGAFVYLGPINLDQGIIRRKALDRIVNRTFIGISKYGNTTGIIEVGKNLDRFPGQ